MHQLLVAPIFNYKTPYEEMVYEDCTLNIDVGEFPAGTHIDIIEIDIVHSKLMFYDKGYKELAQFDLELKIVKY